MLGSLDSIEESLTDGRFGSFESRVTAAVLRDLLDQADTLISANYHLAAAVLLRGVLEEHLRKLCTNAGVLPTKNRLTISDYQGALAGASLIDKTDGKDITWMADVGNKAAHNKPEFDPKEIPLLYSHVLAFLQKHT
jgi:hypothetical protein